MVFTLSLWRHNNSIKPLGSVPNGQENLQDIAGREEWTVNVSPTGLGEIDARLDLIGDIHECAPTEGDIAAGEHR